MSASVSAAEACGHLIRRAPQEAIVIPGLRQIDARKVVHVALDPDDVLRNLQVALLYSLTSTRLHERLTPEWGPGKRREKPPPCNANWFTVAQWAVLTVGRNLRSDDAPHRASALPQALRRRLTPVVLNLRSADDRRVAAALSYGQVMVFSSVYHALLKAESRWDQTPQPDAAAGTEDGVTETEPSPEAIISAPGDDARAVGLTEQRAVIEFALQLGAEVDPGWIDTDEFYPRVLGALAARAGHEGELDAAFELYEGALKAVDISDEERASLIFEATLRITAIEQTILDDAVTLVVDHLPRHFIAQAEGRLATFAERSWRIPRRIARVNSSRRIARVAGVATDVWARVMTDQVLVVAFPAETIRLGRDLPCRDWRKPFFAPGLQTLSKDAQDLYDQFDRSLGDGRGAGAGDWRRFDDRMNFAANLLRSRQQDPTLFWQPFTDEDVLRVWKGGYPSQIADPFEQAVRRPWYPDELDTRIGDGGIR